MIDADMTEMDVVEIALTSAWAGVLAVILTAERLGQHALTWKRRLVEAEATIQRVRELHYNTATHHPSGCCSECGGTYPCPTVRALDGGAE